VGQKWRKIMELTSVLESGMGCYTTKSKSSFFLLHWNHTSLSSEKIRKKVYFSLAIKATNATLHFFFVNLYPLCNAKTNFIRSLLVEYRKSLAKNKNRFTISGNKTLL